MKTWTWLRHTLRTWHRQERGQVIVLAAGAMVVVLGAAALAVDIGFFAHTKRDLQNDADAMALAGAQEIPNQGLANSKARVWGTNNDVDLSGELVGIEFNTTCSGAAQPNVITVRLRRDQPTYLARVLGITEGTMHACATAGRFSVDRFMYAAPWGIEDNCIWGPDGQVGGSDDILLGESITLKYDADNTGADCDANTGNFGALAIDDTGAGSPCGSDPGPGTLRKYGEAICWGATSYLGVGDLVSTETGNIVSRTRDSIEYLFDNVNEACDTWDEVMVEVDGTPTLKPQCNPMSTSYVGGASIVKLIPVLNGLWDMPGGSAPVPIVDFVFVVLEPPPPGNWCTGNSCDIVARFVERASIPAGSKGPLDPESLITTVALVE